MMMWTGGMRMGLLSWLFGVKRQLSWQSSEIGHPTMVWDGLRITVVPYYRDWKYLIAPENDSLEPFYSDKFRTEADAKAAAVAHVKRL